MKKLVLLYSLLCFTYFQPAKAQTNWSQPGATWYYSCNDPFLWGYTKFEQSGDTIINGITCDRIIENLKVATNFWPFNINNFYSHYTYQNNDTAYKWFGNHFEIMAIYNAQIGDTWPMSNDTNNCNGIKPYFQVDSIGSVVICNDTLTRYFLTAYFSNQQGGFWPQPTTLTEKLGYQTTMFYYDQCVTDYLICNPLRCYSDSSGCNYSTGAVPYCNYVTAIENTNGNTPITITPNPAKENITITNYFNADGDNMDLQISDHLGRTVLKHTLTQNSEMLNVAALQPGYYVVSISKNGSKIYVNKLLIIN